MRNLTRHIYEYFYYTRAERNATIVLIFLCTFFFVIPQFYHLIFPPPPPVDFSEYKAMIAAFMEEKEMAEKEAVSDKPDFRNEAAIAPSIELFQFDPNTVTKDELVRLGLSARTAQTMLNYRAKGGKFFKKEDLKKVYGLRVEDYERLEEWMVIERKQNNFTERERFVITDKKEGEPKTNNLPGASEAPIKKSFPKKEYTPVSIDINKATEEEWQQLRGIGPAFSKRIVNFRDKLGGFSHVDQVKETYGLPDSTFQAIKPYLSGSPIFKKITLNSCELEVLKKHPLINNYQATILFNYRKQHGPLAGMDDLKKIKAGFKESDWVLLEPYFSFE